MGNLLTILTLFLFASQPVCHGQLKAYYSTSRLPKPSYTHSIMYDEDDSIYIFGGQVDVENRNQILKYSLYTDQITVAGKLPGSQGIFEYGYTTRDNSGNIFIFGSRNSPTDAKNDIIKFCPVNNTTEIVARYHDPDMDTGPIIKIKSNSNKIWIFGDRKSNFLREFDMETFRFRDLVNLNDTFFEQGAAVVPFNDTGAYIFNNFWGFDPKVKEMNLETMEMRYLEHITMPASSEYFPQGMTDGESIFLVSSYVLPLNGILKFEPLTESFTSFNVTNWPLEYGVDGFLFAPKCSFVSKLNRIYCFGGYTGFQEEIDFIFWVDMEPLSDGMD